MKDVNGIQTPFDNAICSPADYGGTGMTDVGGVSIKDGQKGTSGEMPETSGVTLPDSGGTGGKRPDDMPGS